MNEKFTGESEPGNRSTKMFTSIILLSNQIIISTATAYSILRPRNPQNYNSLENEENVWELLQWV